MRVLVINGPNLDLLGRRQPEVYGAGTLADLEAAVAGWGRELGVEVECLQSNHEGDLIEAIHGADRFDGILINPGALTHTSRALADALAGVGVPAVEVHISDIRRREPWRAVSFVADHCVYSIFGRGIEGYRHALRHLRNRDPVPETIRYGPEPDQVADLRLPESDPRGLVLMVHGGFWLEEWTRDTTESLCVDLARRGFATANLEYRRLGSGGGWPASGHDVLTAIGRITEALAGLPSALVGHSAGGFLGLWASTRTPSRDLRLFVGLASITDLEALAAGDAPGSASAATLLTAGAPRRLDPGGSPGLLVHGEGDRVVPAEHSAALAGSARVELLPDDDHFGLLDPQRPHWPPIVSELEQALG